MRYLPPCALLILAFTFNAPAQAQLYKSVAPDGRVTYSDAPPPSARHIEIQPPATGTANTTGLPYELAEAVKANPVTLYSGKNCGPCDEGRSLLSARGIPFTEKTVQTNEDAAAFRKLYGDNNLPLLLIGRTRQVGFEAQAWGVSLTAAGYPASSKLPRSYRQAPAQALAPVPQMPSTAPTRSVAAATTEAAASPSSDLPPPAGNAPPGFRF